jgi:SAM-dependent methyltransferase
MLERLYGSLDALKQKEVYIVEAVTGFSFWLRRHLGTERVLCSEYLNEVEADFSDITHQDLCELTLSSANQDLVLCNEIFEHIIHLDQALSEIARVLKPGGRLVATCPMAFGQNESIIKAISDGETGETLIFGEPEFHGDPLRLEHGSLVFQIPGWDVLDQLKRAGMAQARIHHVASWKHGILGSDLPGVLVIEAQK